MRYLKGLILFFLLSAQVLLNAGNTDAKPGPGELYKAGLDYMKDGKDWDKALELFLKAEKEGYRENDIYLAIGRIYAESDDPQRAFRWNEKAALNGNAEGELRIALAYCYGDGVEQNHEKGLEWLRKAAAKGDAVAEEHIGISYMMGFGGEEDSKEALKWFIKAAEKGNVPAQVRAGRCYIYCKDKDYRKAVEWLLKAAEQQDHEAMKLLGKCYMSGGYGVVKDRPLAFEWYSKAAELGNHGAEEKLGDCYYYGRGTGKNRAKALEFYSRAAEYGYNDAQLKAFTISLEDKNVNEAVKYAYMLSESEETGQAERMLADFIICASDVSKGNFRTVAYMLDKYMGELAILFFMIFSLLALISGGMLLFLLLLYFVYCGRDSRRGPFKLRDAFTAFALLLLTHIFFALLFGIAASPAGRKFGVEPELCLFLSAVCAAVTANFLNIVLWALIIKTRKCGIKEAFRLFDVKFRKWIFWLSGSVIFILFFDYAYEYVFRFFGKTIPPQELVAMIQKMPVDGGHVPHIVFIIISIGLLIPVFEEIIFRGVIYQAMKARFPDWVAALFSSALFAAIHMDVLYFIPLFVFGLLLCYVYKKSNSIIMPIAMHCLNNTFFVLALFSENIF